jgi:hypothetical protein
MADPRSYIIRVTFALLRFSCAQPHTALGHWLALRPRFGGQRVRPKAVNCAILGLMKESQNHERISQ